MAPVLRIFPALVFPEGDYLMEPYEILAGPLTIWLSPVGTAFPLIDAEPGAEWKLMGTRGTRNMSNDGVTVQLNQTVNDVIPAGAVGPVKAFRPEARMMFGATLWDCSLGQFTHALGGRSEEHPSELQSLMRLSYAVFCLK